MLAYIGVKMLLTHSHPIPAGVSLAMVTGILSVGLMASLIANARDDGPEQVGADRPRGHPESDGRGGETAESSQDLDP
jgi:hypothetical protein